MGNEQELLQPLHFGARIPQLTAAALLDQPQL